jgi:hypothetical protein
VLLFQQAERRLKRPAVLKHEDIQAEILHGHLRLELDEVLLRSPGTPVGGSSGMMRSLLSLMTSVS